LLLWCLRVFVLQGSLAFVIGSLFPFSMESISYACICMFIWIAGSPALFSGRMFPKLFKGVCSLYACTFDSLVSSYVLFLIYTTSYIW
jgi:hypothetical protein